MAQDLNDEQKLRRMAQVSSFYRAAVAELVEDGFDPDELDTAVEEMEEALEQERADKRKRRSEHVTRLSLSLAIAK